MPPKQIKLRLFPDGRVEAEVDGIPGKGCLKLIPLIEQLIGGETIDSKRTENYYLEEVVSTELSQEHALRVTRGN